MKVSPMMEQYFEIKNHNRNCLLFFRLGDFYELFFEDAKIASKELNLTLTGKDYGQTERAPMCGVPFHSADGYIGKLVERGYRVAICEQMEDAKQTKGLVRREVIRVITPGTVIDTKMLDETKNNYICSVYVDNKSVGMAFADISTGEFCALEFSVLEIGTRLCEEIARFKPAEVICNETAAKKHEFEQLGERFSIKPWVYDEWAFDYKTANGCLCRHFGVAHMDGYGMGDKKYSVIAAGALLQYLRETQKNELDQILTIKYDARNRHMAFDVSSRRNLELTESLHDKSQKGTLLWVLNETKTAMGARLLRKWIEQPLVDKDVIVERHLAVKELNEDYIISEEIGEILSRISDFERIMSKITCRSANARDLISLKQSIAGFPSLKELLGTCTSPLLEQWHTGFDTLSDIYLYLHEAIEEDPPFSVREGGFIKASYSEEINKLRRVKEEGSNWLLSLEEEEKAKTGIKNLKIRYNKIFGYYIEVTKSNIGDVPERYVRKQTLSNCERYTTTELGELEEMILGADGKLVEEEYRIFSEVITKIGAMVKRILQAAYHIAVLDVVLSFSVVAVKQRYVMPRMVDNGVINIKSGRHPVVEKFINQDFIPNDTFLDTGDSRLSIITGPNMAGKSTYMRQVALIVLMAQIGSYIPAEEAEIGIVDRIFTRVGASDDLASGKSTFMVEMTEVANILNTATSNSLLILDEIGRGTSTFDGLSIAWAVLEYIADTNHIGAKTLFATHYHELTELEGKLSGVNNYCITAKEQGEDIVFLRKIVRGGADNSYGIQVAKLAGLPIKVVRRSKEILRDLNDADITKKAKKIAKSSGELAEEKGRQVDLFNMQDTQLADEIRNINIMDMSPMDALQTLFKLQNRVKGL